MYIQYYAKVETRDGKVQFMPRQMNISVAMALIVIDTATVGQRASVVPPTEHHPTPQTPSSSPVCQSRVVQSS